MLHFDLPPEQPAPEIAPEPEQSKAARSSGEALSLDHLLSAAEPVQVRSTHLIAVDENSYQAVEAVDPPTPASPDVAADSPAIAPPDVAEETLSPPAELPTEPPTRIEIEADPELTPAEFANQLRLTADYQEYDPIAQTVIARGNVLLLLNDAIIEADELWVNLVNRYVLAEGNVLLTRGAQLIRGTQAEYNFIQQAGVVSDAVGTLYLPDVAEDLRSPLEGPSSTVRRAYDPIGRRSDLQVNSDGGVQITTSSAARPTGSDDGTLRQLRFETESLAFDVEGWRAEDVRITNDPFSPPELELRTDRLVLRNISPTQDELLFKRPRLVFDQGFALPLLRSRIVLDRGTLNPDDLSPVPTSAGIDGSDRGGLYIGAKVPLVRNDSVRLSVTPQFFAARAFSDQSSSPFELGNFGATADLRAQLTPRTTLRGSADLTSLNLTDITENLRVSLRGEQLIGNHRLALQYSYRDRLFNGSLGFQDVQSSLGAVLLSPNIALGDSGLQLTYQAGAQLINARSDRADLLAESGSDTGRVTLGRYQGSAALRRSFNLWRGQPAPATQFAGLRYTPAPVVPYLNLNAGLRVTGTYYSSGDFQDSLIAEIGIDGQVGQFARSFGDYTRFNVSYAQAFIGGADSPFLFDREVDRSILSLGITQQVYGPFLVGFQTSLSLSEAADINTVYSLEYSRRTYGILLRYDAAQNTGSVGFRLSNFSWIGDTNPFDTPRLRQVEGGVIEQP